MKKYMPLEGLRWSRDSGSTLCDTPQNGRSRTGWGMGQYMRLPGIVRCTMIRIYRRRLFSSVTATGRSMERRLLYCVLYASQRTGG